MSKCALAPLDYAVVVDARDLPPDVEKWCAENDISTHYDNSLVPIGDAHDEDTPLLRWLQSRGVDLSKFSHIGILGT